MTTNINITENEYCINSNINNVENIDNVESVESVENVVKSFEQWVMCCIVFCFKILYFCILL